jgi:hypothetical protein
MESESIEQQSLWPKEEAGRKLNSFLLFDVGISIPL